MSRVHEAMRGLERRSTHEEDSAPAPSNLIGALIAELADEVSDDPNLETVRADLLSASRSYEVDKKKELALRFYLAMRSALRAHEMLQERLRKAEKKLRIHEAGNDDKHVALQDREEGKPEVHAQESAVNQHSEQASAHHG
jgi:hypothetical protein